MINEEMTPNQVRYSRINEKEQYCQYCSCSLDDNEQCDHFDTIHLSCVECCSQYGDNEPSIDKNDLD
jgi:hypothetical protein